MSTKLNTPPAGASRFHVVFSRATGSRKQRAKREGNLSISYHTTSLFDTDAKECVMVCRGTGLTPNRIFAKMQAARRGASWTPGTELTLNGYEVVIEDVMELHLIPYDEEVRAFDADGGDDGATSVLTTATKTAATPAVERHHNTLLAPCPAWTNVSVAPFNAPPPAFFDGQRPPMKSAPAALSLSGVGANANVTAATCAPIVVAAQPLFSADAHKPERPKATSEEAASEPYHVRSVLCESYHGTCVQSSVAVDKRCDFLSTQALSRTHKLEPQPKSEGRFKRSRSVDMEDMAAAAPQRRVRRSAASVARELRSAYPHYF